MKTGPAVYYRKEGYDTAGQRLLGRQAAGEGFLRGLARYGRGQPLYCYAPGSHEFEDFSRRVSDWSGRAAQVREIPFGNLVGLREPGLLYLPYPGIAEAAWQRRRVSSRNHSICGVTHTIASREVLAAIGDFLTAPVEPWDALICTSAAVRGAVDDLLGRWGEYLAERTGGRPEARLQLPVIPLGIDCDRFDATPHAADAGRRLREQHGIAPSDTVILYVGRLIFYAKAHPVPMYMALERAAAATGRRLHLIQAGWFEEPGEEQEFRRAAQAFAPSVSAIFLDGRDPGVRASVWHAADIFVSLSDNIQETFGITPIEAMAAGLPVVVSDWDGYRESVRDGIDGFRVPTLVPPPGTGADLASSYLDDRINYSTFIGYVAMCTAVDVDACASALARLVGDPELRRQMGEQGRRREREVYDWRRVIATYEDLWDELTAIRSAGPSPVAERSATSQHPILNDPFRFYARYPTAALEDGTLLGPGEQSSPDRVELLFAAASGRLGRTARTSEKTLLAVVAAVRERGPTPVSDLVRAYAGENPIAATRLRRSLVYLLKFDVLKQVGT